MSLKLLQHEGKTPLLQEATGCMISSEKNSDSAKAQRFRNAEMLCADVAQSLPL